MKKIIYLLIILSTQIFAEKKEVSLKDLTYDMQFFKDRSCVNLKENIKKSDLKKFKSFLLKDIASKILEGKYDTTYRAVSYKAYHSNKGLYEKTKIDNGFSLYENITGIYLEKGKNVIMVSNLYGKEVSLLIPDFHHKSGKGKEDIVPEYNIWELKNQKFSLKEGINIIEVSKEGNAYIDYHQDKPEDAPLIKVHFLTGLVNGFFDIEKNNLEDWKKLLDNAKSPLLDARGKYIQVVYPVKWLKYYVYDKGIEMIELYDKMLYLQYSFSGLVKYNRIPKSRILSRVNYHYRMFRDENGVAYLGDSAIMGLVMLPDLLLEQGWGFNHEIGHVMQLKPQLTWGGMTEVSCNIFSMYITTTMGAKSRLKEDKVYQSAFTNILDTNIFYLTEPNVFQRLVPFWQLHLYFTKNGFSDFYADVMEELRNREHKGKDDESINNMFDFIKVCCDITKTDLTDFFEKWGFFVEGKYSIKDYKIYNFNITSKMISDTKDYIKSKNYSKLKEDITRLED